jgi:two-component system, NarL family, invasion response regulator UvrY
VINVLIVDDHEVVRAGISRLLSDITGIKVMAAVCSGEEAIKFIKDKPPHVVLMDVKMPGIGGLEATRKILQTDPEVKVIALTSCEGETFPTKFLQVGAKGYLTKGTGIEEMVLAIRTVQAGKRYLGPEIAQLLAFKTLEDKDSLPFDSLSDREMQILLMITSGQKVQAISDKLCLSPKTVNTYRYRLFEKLNVSTDVELTHLAIRHKILDMEIT